MIFYQENEYNQHEGYNHTPQSGVIHKIDNFFRNHSILINQFWQTNRNYSTADDIGLFCEIVGLKLTAQDMINLKSELFSEKEVISIYDFCKVITYWRNDPNEAITQFLKRKTDSLIDNIQNKNKISRNASTKLHSRPSSVVHNRNHSANNSKQNRLYRPNNSKKYLQSYKERMKQKQQELAEVIQRTKNQFEYSMLIKMNQINEINRKNKSSITYRAYKNAEGSINVRVFDFQTLKKQITLKEFESQYKVFMKSSKENKEWDLSKSCSKSQSNGISNKVVKAEVLKKNQKKEERQKQLRNLLENTVKLTELLQEQIRIFKARGIYGTEKYA